MKRNLAPALFCLALFVPICPMLTGCSSTNITKLTQALAKDPAAVCVRVTTLYGNVSFTRVGARTNETVTVSPDGTMTVKTGTQP